MDPEDGGSIPSGPAYIINKNRRKFMQEIFIYANTLPEAYHSALQALYYKG